MNGGTKILNSRLNTVHLSSENELRIISLYVITWYSYLQNSVSVLSADLHMRDFWFQIIQKIKSISYRMGTILVMVLPRATDKFTLTIYKKCTNYDREKRLNREVTNLNATTGECYVLGLKCDLRGCTWIDPWESCDDWTTAAALLDRFSDLLGVAWKQVSDHGTHF